MWLAEVGGGFELLRRETHLPGGSRFKASLRELPGEAFPSLVTQSGACPTLGKGEAFTLLPYGWERYFFLIFKGVWDLHLPKDTASARYCPDVTLEHLEAL